jgi:hypothetical protein
MGDDLDHLPENALVGIVLCIMGLMILLPIFVIGFAR